ncbi:L,D-transpeptidase [filamentous cyanobacterium LEGE 11480]|uniref:L,D-transpeptidase n=1 Tax=Romeriopsis navalis LEGE 11480 TaxID=2777977 RepID=A0A928VRY1_9CYAN|nr:L,D-transpeptidase [Romeriopsis navalis]MBE9031079.1 L,D-transpeptidase [Romeriopsis navalis LEGE 11480]
MPRFLSRPLRVSLIIMLGLGTIYKFAHGRGLIPSVSSLTALAHPIVCPADATMHAPPNVDGWLRADQSLQQLVPQDFDQKKVSLLIEKSKHRLTVYYDGVALKSYPVVFGRGKGDKRREGDLKTPEGILKIQDKYPHPDWSKFLWLDYPNQQSRCKHNRAKQTGKIPLWSTVGSEVGIHGVPAGADDMVINRINWTWGCPSMRNADINELYPFVPVGTIVEIVA